MNDTDIAVHLYMQNTAQMSVGGREVSVRQETTYPWNGTIALRLSMDKPVRFGLRLRIPGWCEEAQLRVNGEGFEIDRHLEHGYVRVERVWQSGDRVELELEMSARRMYAHPDIRQDAGCVVLQRGPLVYCLEGTDNNVPLHRIVVPRTTELASQFEADMLGGVTVICGEALVEDDSDWAGRLYRSWSPTLQSRTITAIPYYAWDNREAGEMRVWLRESNGGYCPTSGRSSRSLVS